MRLLGYRRIGLFDNYGLGTAVSTFAIFAFALLALLCRAFAILTRCAVLTLRSFGASQTHFSQVHTPSAHLHSPHLHSSQGQAAQHAVASAATVSVSTTCTSAAFLAFLLPHAVITKAAIATMQTSVNFFMVFKF